MFDYNSMIERVVDFFPRWMDIRKRYKTSTGGKLLGSIVEELTEVEEALNEYKKYYFLDTYEGHEDEVVAFAFKANIGKINDLKLLTIESPSLEVTTDLEYFLNHNDKAYYEEGYIYLKTLTVETLELTSIVYSYDDFVSSADLVHTHIWNIFDEFACFCNMSRQEKESNSQLVNRILYHNKNLPNATTQGLKHAIVSELLTAMPDISTEEIDIHTVTANDLFKPYKSFNTLLDKLAEVNRDVYKEKRWDLDYWQYDFKSIEYIDHMWDVTLQEYQNGIGSEDDLQVLTADATTATDVQLNMYQKSAEKVSVYVHDKKIPKKLKFNMSKYNNVLNSSHVKYKVTASEAYDITKEEIELTAYNESRQLENRNIQDLFRIGNGIVPIDNTKITDYGYYKLEITPDSLKHHIEIAKLKVLYKNKTTGAIVKTENLLKQTPGFVLNADGVLTNTSMKKGVTSVNDFNSYEDLMNSENGVTLADDAISGKGTLDLAGMEMKYFSISHYCDLTPLPKSAISLSYDAFWSNDVVHFKYETPGERSTSINVRANKVAFDVLDTCQIDILEITNDETIKHTFIGPGRFETELMETPKDIKLKINSTYYGQVRLANFEYNHYEVKYSLSKGSFLTTSSGQLMLPGFTNNTLSVDMRTMCSAQPVIRSIYIGSDLTRIKYYSAIVSPMSDCDRVFEISTTGQINLLKTDPQGNELSRTDDYNPATSYKSIKDNAFIRLDLSEYTSIENIITNIGYKEIIEESGVKYYQIRLKDGDTISKVTIDGYRAMPAKKITLEDMIKAYMPSYDNQEDFVYVSRISDGIIIRDNGETPNDIMLEIRNDIFEGIIAQKFEITKIPDDITCCFVSGESVNYSTVHEGRFTKIKFYPRRSDTYTAINDYNLLTPEVRNIEIVNNFNPQLPQDNNMLVYKVEAMASDTVNFDVRFNDRRSDGKLFEELYRWTLGSKKISIKSKTDLSNQESYDIDSYDIEEDVVLAQHIDIKKSYSINNSMQLITAEHIITPPENTELVYKTYDITKPETESLIKYEEIVIQNDGFNKLKYSNIDTILHLSTEHYIDDDKITIEDYSLLNKEGIIVWTSNTLINSAQKIYIKYTIKEPVAFKFNLDAIYKELNYEVDAYRHIDTINLRNIPDGYKTDLYTIPSYEECDLIQALCSTPGFESIIDDKYLTIKKTAKLDSILVKSGYYYINGREYYLFTENDALKAEDVLHVDFYNVDRSGGELEFIKETNNYVKNSEMRLKGLGEVSSIKANETDVVGVSMANALTACSNFNDWQTFDCRLSLTEGLNGVGMLVSQRSSSGYALINITDSLAAGQNFISFYAEEALEVFIGTEESIYELQFPRNLNIKIAKEIFSSTNDNMRLSSILKEDNKKYYLIVKGDGLIDDIMIRKDETLEDIHEKNIDKLKLEIDEHLVKGYRYIMSMKDNKGVKNTGAGIDSKGYIVNTTQIDWGVTIVDEFTDRDGFMKGTYNDVTIEQSYIKTDSRPGVYTTGPVFLDNPLAIKRLFFKINDIDFKDMIGFKITVLTSATLNGDYTPVSYHNDNIGYAYGDYLSRYIKLKIEMPKEKVIDNICILSEYKSTELHSPKAYTSPFGELISKVYDAHYSANFRVRSIKLATDTNVGAFDISVRASRDKYSADVWMPWKEINIGEDLKVINNEIFTDARFFQFKIKLKNKDAKIKFKGVEIEVI